MYDLLNGLTNKFHVILQGLITFLVNENGFNNDRVTKVSMFIFGCSWFYAVAVLVVIDILTLYWNYISFYF